MASTWENASGGAAPAPGGPRADGRRVEPGRGVGGLRPAAPDERLQRVVVGRLQHVVAPEHVGDLPEDHAQFAEVERHLLELQDRRRRRRSRRASQPASKSSQGVETRDCTRCWSTTSSTCMSTADASSGCIGLQAAEGGQLRGVGAFGTRA